MFYYNHRSKKTLKLPWLAFILILLANKQLLGPPQGPVHLSASSVSSLATSTSRFSVDSPRPPLSWPLRSARAWVERRPEDPRCWKSDLPAGRLKTQEIEKH